MTKKKNKVRIIADHCPTFKIMTFGCQMNENDSEKIAGLLIRMGYREEPDELKTGLIILNTCSVRENADQRVFGNIGAFKTIKKKNPNLILAVCGCMMQQAEIVETIKKVYPQVDLIFGTHNFHHLPQMLNNFLKNGRRRVEIWEDSPTIVENLPIERKYPFKAYVTIMNGCNNFCTYCIVPYTRGRELSRDPDKIFEEVLKLSENGCLEITLLGQNVNSYGNDLEEDINFASLLARLNTIEGIRRIRFMTSHPKDLTDQVIKTIATSDKICNYIHLPIQSGSTRILKAMNRKYNQQDILDRVAKIRELIPGVAITTDLIIGFPGESEEDFEETLKLIKICQFDSAFTFLYSIRSGTPAADMIDQIPDKIKHERMNRCLEILHPISYALNKEYEDKIFDVLVEEPSRNNSHRLSGRTESGKLVNFSGDQNKIGKIVKVRITRAKSFSLDGEMIEEVKDVNPDTHDASISGNS